MSKGDHTLVMKLKQMKRSPENKSVCGYSLMGWCHAVGATFENDASYFDVTLLLAAPAPRSIRISMRRRSAPQLKIVRLH